MAHLRWAATKTRLGPLEGQPGARAEDRHHHYQVASYLRTSEMALVSVWDPRTYYSTCERTPGIPWFPGDECAPSAMAFR